MPIFPKISIITPVFNSDHLIKSCIINVASQTYLNKEHIIIDGGSSDNTVTIIENYAAQYPHIKWISEKDEGIYDAMNKGIDLSSGEWLYFLGSDDIFFNDDVVKNVLYDTKVHQYDLIYGNVIFKHSGEIYDGKFSSFKLLEKNICHQAIFYRRNIFEMFGKYNKKYKICSDWVFNMRCFNSKKIKRLYVDLIISIYNERGVSWNDKDPEFMKERVRLGKQFSSPLIIFLYENRHRRGFWRLSKLLGKIL